MSDDLKMDTEKKKQAEKDIADPVPSSLDELMEYASVKLTGKDGAEIIVDVPHLTGRPSADVKQEAIEYARAFRRVGETWRARITPEQVEIYTEAIARIAGTFVVQNLAHIAEERFGEEKAMRAFGEEKAMRAFGDDAASMDAVIQEAFERYRDTLTHFIQENDPASLAFSLEKQITAGILLDFETALGPEIDELSGEEYDQRFAKAYSEQYSSHLKYLVDRYAEEFAQVVLEDLKPNEATLDELVGLIRVVKPTPNAFMLATHSFPRAMTTGLLHSGLMASDHRISVRENGVLHLAKVRTEVALDVPSELAREKQEAVLMNMQRALLQHKEQSAALLKMHHDLMDQAYLSHGAPFVYSLHESLERRGYERQKKGSFHHDTLRSDRERLEVMYRHRVTAWKLKNEEIGDVLIAKTPYWIIEETYYTRQGALDLDVMPTIYGTGKDDHYTGALVRPGNWWTYADMGNFHLPMPREILQLRTDGRGNERERMALLLATYLATYVRTNQKKDRVGKRRAIGTGKLLESAGITTSDEFFGLKQSAPALRLRDYLLDTNGDGALAILKDLKAFDVEVRDWDDFYAPGRGWKERFWNSQVAVFIPDLNIGEKAKASKKELSS